MVPNNGRRAVGTGDVEVPKALVSLLIVMQILLRLLLAQSFSLFIIAIHNFMFGETISYFMFSGLMSFVT